MKDEILEELWKIKEEIAQECGGDISRLVEGLNEREKCSSVPVVDLSKDAKKVPARKRKR